jgi:hypothetical protein
MNPILKLSTAEFHDRFGEYLDNSLATGESADFEAAIEREAFDRLVKDWKNGWDFETRSEYFGGRGTSILILNSKIDWRELAAWLCARAGSMPPGALINFEVYDSIKGELMVGGPMLLRRVMTASGIFEDGNEHEEPVP